MTISRANMGKQIRSGKMKKKVVKKKSGSKILGSISPLYGMISGEGAFGKLASAGFSPAAALAKQQKKKKQMQSQEPVPMKSGGSMKAVPSGNKGLSKLPKEVRNKMGYMSYGGKPKKMKHGGTCGGMGKAVRGGKFSRNG